MGTPALADLLASSPPSPDRWGDTRQKATVSLFTAACTQEPGLQSTHGFLLHPGKDVAIDGERKGRGAVPSRS